MFGIGAQELIIILVVALVVFGPKRLPELARSLGRGLAEFRRASSDLRHTLNQEPEPDPPSGAKGGDQEDVAPELSAGGPASSDAPEPDSRERKEAKKPAGSGGE